MDKSIQITLIIVLGVILSVFIFSNSFRGDLQYQGKTITVEGVSSVKAMPNIVSVYFNIETKDKTSENASAQNAQIVEELRAKLVKEGFSEDKIQTQSFNVYPDYTWDSFGKRKDNGFIATHSIRLEMNTSESSKIGKAIDGGVSAGAGISYINFELSQDKQNEYKAEAMKLAAQDAKIKAQATASGLDKNVGELVSVSINNFGYSPWNVYSGTGVKEEVMDARVASTSITPSEQEVSASVSAVFKLK